MEKVKCPLCFGTGKIDSNEGESWKGFFSHSKEYIEGYTNGYDKCTSDNRSVILRKSMETTKPFEEQLYNLFVKLGQREDDKSKEQARNLAWVVCMELGLNRNLKKNRLAK